MTDNSIAVYKSDPEDTHPTGGEIYGAPGQNPLRPRPIIALIIFCIFPLAFLGLCFTYTVFSYLVIGESGPAFLGGLLTFLDLWLMKTLITARRKNTQPWKIIHLPTQNPQPRKSLQPYGWTAIAFGASTIALTACAIHAAATYHKQPWAAYILVPACIALATTAVYGGRKHALANGPHPGGPIWWLNNNYYTRPEATDPIIGGALVTATGLILPVMVALGQTPPTWRSPEAVKAWIVETLLTIFGLGIISMGIIQKRWERKHPPKPPEAP